MIHRLEISEKARMQLRELPKEQRRLIGQRIEALRYDLQGDIKKLTATKNRYRLRAGDYRVFFVLENDSIAIYGVRNRKEAYMSKTAALRVPRRRSPRPTMRLLQQRIDQLQERLEDLEDLRDLERAIAENGRTPLVPWDKVKKELGLA